MEQLLAILRGFIPKSIFDALAPAYHWTLAWMAAIRYGFPSHSLTVIGVTGTDGKTTTVHLLHEMLALGGHRVGSLSSLRFRIGDRGEPNFLKMTMPGRFRLQRFLADCRGAGCAFAVIEVTSQGIAQHRHRFINFKAAVLTNITPEHIESHGGFEQYRGAKIELFRLLPRAGFAILNHEDASARHFGDATRAHIVWYSRSSIDGAGISHSVRSVVASQNRIALEMGSVPMETALGGGFNVMNILAATAAAMSFDVPLAAIATALKEFPGMAGRLEFVVREPFAVVVDYANTPAAYEKLYQTLTAGTSHLICVFGAPGGGRDKWKRPEIGKIAAKYCREIILTSDDPDEENPGQIVSEIQSGIISNQETITKVFLDRREAIRQALSNAKPGDTVIITGMGAQPWQIIKGKKIQWDDRRVVREELQKLEDSQSANGESQTEIDLLATKIWDYHLMHQKLEKGDCILVLGSHDKRVAEYAAKLFSEGRAPVIVFAGTGLGHKSDLLGTIWDRTEADVFAAIALERGVPQDRILIERKSKNTADNIAFSRALLYERGLRPQSIILVQKPYMERRAYATFRRVWPDVGVTVTSPPIPFAEYPTSEISKEKVINLMVGDLQRIIEYPVRGFQIPQDVPQDVRLAYERLVRLGYARHLIR